MSNPFLSLLSANGRASEDVTTNALADCLRQSQDILGLYLEFLFGTKTRPNQILESDLRIVTQHTFSPIAVSRAQVGSRGKIDLALIDASRSVFIGVEYKVRDGEKPSRLHNYRLLMQAEGHTKHWLFEIVQIREHNFPNQEVVNAIRTWNELHEFFVRNATRLITDSDRTLLRCYCEFLELSGTVLESGSLPARRGKRHPEHVPESTSRPLYEKISRKLTDANCVIMADKNLPLHMRIQGRKWASKFPGHWHQRVWMYAKVLDTHIAYPVCQIIFHNANFTAFDYAAKMLPGWAEIASRRGMVISRGPARGWDGRKGARVEAPWKLDCQPKYFFAEDDEISVRHAIAGQVANRGYNFVDYATEQIERCLEIVDRFAA